MFNPNQPTLLQQSTTGQDLLDVVIKHLNLLETSYFGLKYLRDPVSHAASARPTPSDQSSGYYATAGSSAYYADGLATPSRVEHVWLDVGKSAIKQLRHAQPMTVYFGVKYYAPDPCKLAEEITRYQFFLQIKRDILDAKLPVPFDLAVELLALAVQSELGDYDPARHPAGYVAEFRFVAGQTAELEHRAALWHRQLIGQVPATAELNFLERVKRLDLYGCELHPIQYDDELIGSSAAASAAGGTSNCGLPRPRAPDSYALGLAPSGLLVLRNCMRVAQYNWPRIVRSKCQGRCFLIDVIDLPTGSGGGGATSGPRSSRFGFRLRDKDAARRLRWSVEEHKSFHQLIMQSMACNPMSSLSLRRLNNDPRLQQLMAHQQQQHQLQQQLQQQQQHEQQLKLSQRFRNSIRSAIGGFGQGQMSSNQMQQQFEQQQRKLLRSSMKSLGNIDDLIQNRQAPTVIRMPSRRYGPSSSSHHHLSAPNTIGAGSATTNKASNKNLLDYQANGLGMTPMDNNGKQHRLMNMMLVNNQHQHQMLNGNSAAAAANFLLPPTPINKSQTLKPIGSRSQLSSSSSKQDAKQRNPYYQMMLALAAQQHQVQMQAQRRGNQHQQPEISILPPGQHIVQPSIYRATSVVNGINQLGGNQPPDLVLMRQQHQHPAQLHAMTMDRRRANNYHQAGGHESPRSTKSAMAPSSTLKLASKKLIKQQQLMYSTAGVDLAMANGPTSGHYYPTYSANASPRSTRSVRMQTGANKTRFRSKSTGENLHLLHQQQQQHLTSSNNNRMLLTTANQQLIASLPPPDYGHSTTTNTSGAGPLPVKVMPSLLGGLLDPVPDANLMRSRKSAAVIMRSDDDDEYYCSRSDCSSIVDGEFARTGSKNATKTTTTTSNNLAGQRRARFINGQLINADQNNNNNCRTGSQKIAPLGAISVSAAQSKKQEAIYGSCQQDWDAIKRRHDDFSNGKHLLNQFNSDLKQRSTDNSGNRDTNNNTNSNDLIKNISNKQATPILLSMHNFANNAKQQQQQHQQHHLNSNANSKAVQLLNLQRQQLLNHSQSSAVDHHNSPTINNNNGSKKPSIARGSTSTTGGDTPNPSSAESSVASSPKTPQGHQHPDKTMQFQSNLKAQHHHISQFNNNNNNHQAADSTASNSTTSGYYAGSNSTGPASVDSVDTFNGAQSPQNRQQQQQQQSKQNGANNNNMMIHNQTKGLNSVKSNSTNTNNRIREYQRQQQQFYLGETNNRNDDEDTEDNNDNSLSNDNKNDSNQSRQQQLWSTLEQIQHHPNSSLKYVSFDV